MANEEHVEILKKGVQMWNRWREENPGVVPDLREAELDDAFLADANLDRACLNGASLNRAHLAGASLDRASLNGARLDRAHLVGASFNRACLNGAHLDTACLYRSSLNGAHLDRARLDRARLDDASLAGANLAGANLDRSQGQIPPEFLRGCGLSDWEIEAARLYDPDLTEDARTTIWYEIERIRGQQPWALSRVFLSYTREDAPFVEALERRFDEKGVRYWRDVHDLKAGRLERQIDRAITLYPLVLLVLSERSVLSDWAEWEASKARELERQHLAAGEARDVLCPVALDDAWESCSWPGPLRRQIKDFNVLDFSGWENDTAKMDRQFTRLYEGMVLNYGRKGGARAG